jgi:two-component system phosphate regulon response regulator PhoB
MARVEALLRRSRPSLGGDLLLFSGLELDTTTHLVKRDGKPIHLGPTEFRLLRHFLERPKRVHSRDQLLDAVWGMDKSVDLRTVDVHIRRLRVAINVGGKPDLIRTVRSAGYALDLADQEFTTD